MKAIGIGISPIFQSKSGLTYIQRVLSYSPIAYWPLNETSGVTADNAEGTAARDGTYTGVTLNSSTGPDGEPVGLWDGSTDYCDIYSASLNSAFNGNEGSLSIWCKVSGSGVWTDGNFRRVFRLAVDADNRIYMRKQSNNNQFLFFREGGADGNKFINESGLSFTDWFHVGLTFSTSSDEFKAYINGSAVGVTQTGLGTFAGSLATDSCVIGASTTSPAELWDGYLAHAAIFDSVLSLSDFSDLATI